MDTFTNEMIAKHNILALLKAQLIAEAQDRGLVVHLVLTPTLASTVQPTPAAGPQLPPPGTTQFPYEDYTLCPTAPATPTAPQIPGINQSPFVDYDAIPYMVHPYYQLDATQYESGANKRRFYECTPQEEQTQATTSTTESSAVPGLDQIREYESSPNELSIDEGDGDDDDDDDDAAANDDTLDIFNGAVPNTEKYLKVANGVYRYEIDAILDTFIAGYGDVCMNNHSMIVNFDLSCQQAQCRCLECL